MADINAVAQQFTGFYYQTFDTNRSDLAPLYVRSSFVRDSTSHLPLICFPARLIYAHFRGDTESRRAGHHREADGEHSMPSLKSPIAPTDLTPTLLAVQSLPFQKVQHKVTTLDAQPSSPTVASLIVNVTGLLVVSSTEHIIKPLLDVTSSSSHRPPGRRQFQPTAVLPGVPSYPGWWELLRVRSASSHHRRKLIESIIFRLCHPLIFLRCAASTTYSVSIMALDCVDRKMMSRM